MASGASSPVLHVFNLSCVWEKSQGDTLRLHAWEVHGPLPPRHVAGQPGPFLGGLRLFLADIGLYTGFVRF